MSKRGLTRAEKTGGRKGSDSENILSFMKKNHSSSQQKASNCFIFPASSDSLCGCFFFLFSKHTKLPSVHNFGFLHLFPQMKVCLHSHWFQPEFLYTWTISLKRPELLWSKSEFMWASRSAKPHWPAALDQTRDKQVQMNENFYFSFSWKARNRGA